MNYNAFLLTTLAGLATIIGFLFIYIKGRDEKIIPSALGFSAGIMIIISIVELLPESYRYFLTKFMGNGSLFLVFFFLLLGMALSISINSIIKKDNNHLYHIGLLAFITLILHNIPEGIITYLTSSIALKTGILLTLSIALHNIPEGICIAIPVYYGTGSKLKAFILVLVSALSEPLGAFIAHLFLENNLTNIMIAVLLALVAGLMLTISLMEILKEAKNYSLKLTIKALIMGIILGLMTHLLF